VRFPRRNALGVYAVYGASVVAGLVVTPIVLHELGTETFGIWSFIGAVTIYLAALDLGVAPSVVRATAEARGRRSTEEVSRLASVALAVYGLIGLLTLVAGVALAWAVPALVGAPDELTTETRLCALLIVLGLVARFPLGLFNSLLAGNQRFDLQNAGNFVATILYAVLVAVLLPRGGGLVLLGALTLATTVFRLALPLAWLRREFPGLHLRRAYVSKRAIRELIGISWGNFLAHVASKVVLSADVVVVGVVLGAVNAGIYALASRLFAVALGVASATNPFLLPAFAEAEGAGEVRRQRQLLLLALRGGTALALLVALPLVLLPEDLLLAWVGEGYQESASVLAILGGVALMYQPVSIITQYLVAVRRQRRVAEVFVPAAAVSVALSVAAAYLSGLEAVAWTTLAVVGVVFVVLVRSLRAPLALDYATVARAIARPAVPTVVAGVVFLGGAGRYLDPDSLARLAPVGFAWLLIGAALVWRLGLSAEQRAVIRRVR
jgi:O-antigen/teichoic acid export membrane protein